MKLLNGEIWTMAEPLLKLAKKELPVKTSLIVLKNIKAIKAERETIENVRTDLIKKYGVKGEDGNIRVTRDSERYSDFAKDFAELMDTEAELPVTPFELPESISIDAESLDLMGKIITNKEI